MRMNRARAATQVPSAIQPPRDLAKDVREWVTLILAILGCVLGIKGYLESKQTAKVQVRMQAENLLNEAWDLLGGQTGTSHVTSFTRSSTNLELASRKITQATLLAPSFPKVYTTRGAYYMARRRWTEAIRDYKHAIQLNPDTAIPYNNIGMILVQQGKLGEALSWFRRAHAIDPSDPEPVSNLCYALTKLGRIPEAIAEGQNALRIDSTFSQAYDNLAYALLAKGDTLGARGLLLRQRFIEQEITRSLDSLADTP
jgi:tetratricopeptide (TPR) repeat protein